MPLRNRSAIFSLAAIMAFRMLGLFMILPVFSSYAAHFTDSTPVLIGMVLGVYGLTQALFQIPLGVASDRIGRRPVIALGLALFAAGSLVAALSHSLHGILIGRALQGTGAVGSTILATVADLTCDEQRSKAMAVIGLHIGLSFAVAMMLGPLISTAFGLAGIFWLTAGMALCGLLLLTKISIPAAPLHTEHTPRDLKTNRISSIFKNTQLLRLNFGIFCLHFMLTALFIVIPLLFTQLLKFSPQRQAVTYLVIMLLSFFMMFPLIIYAEKKRQLKTVVITAIATLLATQWLFYLSPTRQWPILFILLLFFTAFTLLEACLPSLVSKIAPIQYKGTAMGIYSTSQFFGIFMGGALGGIALNHFGVHGVFVLCSGVLFLWWVTALTMKSPPYLSTLIFELKGNDAAIQQKLASLAGIEGIAEVRYSLTENLIYTKVDRKIIDKNELRKRIEEVTL